MMSKVSELTYMKESASQTAGPYVHIGLAPKAAGFDIFENNFGAVLAGPKTRGEHIRIEGRVIDGSGTPVRDVLLEIWQANAAGKYAHPDDTQAKAVDPNFRGFGRCATDADGRYAFTTIRPGPVPGRGNALQAPHINVTLFARGLLKQLWTRIYFADQDAANKVDPLLSAIDDQQARQTLIAPKSGSTYRFDIVLQGNGETQFLEL